VIAFQPDLEQIGELPVAGNVSRRKVAVIVQNRLVLSVFVIQAARSGAGQQEVVMDERHR
jgi:hypothetical protein